MSFARLGLQIALIIPLLRTSGAGIATPTMEPATQRFFSIPELISLLSNHLDCKGISRLMRTSRRLREQCAPAHFRSILASFQPGRNNILGSTESTLSLSNNIRHARELKLGLFDLVYYYNCVIAFQGLLSQTQGSTSSRSLWHAPPDPQLCPVLPIPPMTLLTKIVIDIDRQPVRQKNDFCPYYLPSYHDPRATSTQVCWILQLNPHLLHVALSGFIFKDDHEYHLFKATLQKLSKLQHLSLSAFYWTETQYSVGELVFFACPASLRALELDISEWQIVELAGTYIPDYISAEPWIPDLFEAGDEEWGLMWIPQRQKPLMHLASLELWNLDVLLSDDEFLSILQHCLNIRDLVLPRLSLSVDPSSLAKEITKSCPKLSSLTYRDYDDEYADEELVLRIIEALPSQQVQQLRCISESTEIHGLDAAAIFRRHSCTLRELVLSGCRTIGDKGIQVMLVGCEALEVLDIYWSNHRHELCIDLEDAIEFPWVCTKMRRLRLTIGVPDEPLHLHTGVEPYYNRPAPISLSTAEKEQFAQLEVLYRHIGTLTELEYLNLKAFFYDPQGNRPLADCTITNTFPAMLSIGNIRSGRPGYLHHLSGLTKLKELLGSVLVTLKEPYETMGLREAAWMDEHWPALERAQFYPEEYIGFMKDEFRWLMDERRHGGNPLDLSASE